MSADPNESGVDRRRFMLGAAVAAVALSPLAAGVRRALSAEQRDPPTLGAADWSVDDMWTGHPRYAEAIGYPPPSAAREVAALADPVDLTFLA